MKLGQQLKQHRKELGLSQDELAARIFVSRQSISNWENDKTYPDIHTLLLLAEVFGISLDELIKGDVETMKQEISKKERDGFQRDSICFAVLILAALLSLAPLYAFFDYIGVLVWGLLYGVACYFCGRVEMYKTMFDIQTYKEILAFDQGASLDEIAVLRTARPTGARKRLNIIATMLIAAAIGGTCAYGGMWLLDHFGLF